MEVIDSDEGGDQKPLKMAVRLAKTYSNYGAITAT